MTATAHALMGGAIAASISNPAIGLPLAALSHPLTDMIPHWDLGIGWKKKGKKALFFQSTLDLALGLFLTYLIFSPFSAFYHFQSKINTTLKAPWGIFTQGATVLATLLLLRVIH